MTSFQQSHAWHVHVRSLQAHIGLGIDETVSRLTNIGAKLRDPAGSSKGTTSCTTFLARRDVFVVSRWQFAGLLSLGGLCGDLTFFTVFFWPTDERQVAWLVDDSNADDCSDSPRTSFRSFALTWALDIWKHHLLVSRFILWHSSGTSQAACTIPSRS